MILSCNGMSSCFRMSIISCAGLETLSLKENQLTTLGRLTGLRRLQTLLLAGNAIRSLTADALSGVLNPKPQNLNPKI